MKISLGDSTYQPTLVTIFEFCFIPFVFRLLLYGEMGSTLVYSKKFRGIRDEPPCQLIAVESTSPSLSNITVIGTEFDLHRKCEKSKSYSDRPGTFYLLCSGFHNRNIAVSYKSSLPLSETQDCYPACSMYLLQYAIFSI